MKKTDLMTIIKSGSAAITDKISSIQSELVKIKLEKSRGEIKNLRSAKMLRRDLSRLKTAQTLSKLIKDQS